MRKETLTYKQICKHIDNNVFTDRDCVDSIFSVVCITDNPNYNPDEFLEEIDNDACHVSAKVFLENRSKICPISLELVYRCPAIMTTDGNFRITKDMIDLTKKEFKRILKTHKVFEISMSKFIKNENEEERKMERFQKLAESLFEKYAPCNTLVLGGGYTDDECKNIIDDYDPKEWKLGVSELNKNGYIVPSVKIDKDDIKKIFNMLEYDNVSEYLKDMYYVDGELDYGCYLCIIAKKKNNDLYDLTSITITNDVRPYDIEMNYPCMAVKESFK